MACEPWALVRAVGLDGWQQEHHWLGRFRGSSPKQLVLGYASCMAWRIKLCKGFRPLAHVRMVQNDLVTLTGLRR